MSGEIAAPPPQVYAVVAAFFLDAFLDLHEHCHEEDCSHRTDELQEADQLAAVFLDLHLQDFGLAIVPRALCVETPEFPCPEDEHVDVDATGFCRGCGLTTDIPEDW